MLNPSLSSSVSPGHSIQNPNHSLSSLKAFTAAPLNLKASSLSTTKPPHRTISVKCRRHSNHSEQQQRFAPIPPPKNARLSMPPKVFVRHSIYKGNGAFLMEPRPPEFSVLDSGAFKLSREGFMLLQFAPASGVRHYDWDRKQTWRVLLDIPRLLLLTLTYLLHPHDLLVDQVFSLSVAEMGTLIMLGSTESCELLHDPSIGKSDEGQVRKLLKVEPLPDGSGHLFNLSVQNKLINMEEIIHIPVSKAEYTILVSLFTFIVPHLLGWHMFANSIKPEGSLRVNRTKSRSVTDFEWSR